VKESLLKTRQRYKRNFDANVGTQNMRIKVGDYFHTTNDHRQHKLQSNAILLLVVVDADASTFVIDVGGQETRVSSDHDTAAPRPTTADAALHPLLDGLGQAKDTTEVVDEYFIDRLTSIRTINAVYYLKVMWCAYGSKDETWEPMANHPRNMVHDISARRTCTSKDTLGVNH